MFLFSVNGVSIKLERRETLTSGAQNIYLCQFDFGPQWEGLDKTAVFQAQDVKVNVVLDSDCRCQIPYEVLMKPFVKVFAGVYGTKNGELIMPTVLYGLGRVEKGVSLGEAAREPSPEVYDQILANANEAMELARAVKADADAGNFDGADGVTPVIGGNGNWFIGGVDTGKPSKGADGEDGEDGDTPVIGDNGNWYIGGVDTGKPSRGAPGTSSGGSGAGENGATFTPNLDASGNLSWSNDKGLSNPATVNIKGPQGVPGADGASGAKGDDGYTPVKGTDYWTEEDLADMVDQVLAALPDGDEVSY